MRYVIISESVEQLGGAETVAINIADWIIRNSKTEVIFLYKTGNDPDKLQWSHNVTPAVQHCGKFIKVNSDWSNISDFIQADDVLLVQPDWDAQLLRTLVGVKKNHQCKIVTFCHCDSYAPISYYEHPSKIYAEAFEELRPYISLAVALNPLDEYNFQCIGLNSIWWRFGTRAKPKVVPKGARYNRVIAVASNWDRPFKNRKGADELLEVAKEIGYEVKRFGKASDGSSQIATYEDIYIPGTIMVMASFAEARSDQVLEANQSNMPIICQDYWVPDLKNQFVYRTKEDATRILKNLYNKKVKKYARKDLDFESSMDQLTSAIYDSDLNPEVAPIDIGTSFGKAYINNLLRSADMPCHNVETDYSNNIVSLNHKLATVVFDGNSPDETRELFGRQVLFTNNIRLDAEYVVFADNKLLQHNLIMEKLKALGHASIITDKDDMLLAIQTKLLKGTLWINNEHLPSYEFGKKILESINSNPRFKFYKKLEIL